MNYWRSHWFRIGIGCVFLPCVFMLFLSSGYVEGNFIENNDPFLKKATAWQKNNYPLKTLVQSSSGQGKLCISPGSRYLAVVESSRVEIWDIELDKLISNITLSFEFVESAFKSDSCLRFLDISGNIVRVIELDIFSGEVLDRKEYSFPELSLSESKKFENVEYNGFFLYPLLFCRFLTENKRGPAVTIDKGLNIMLIKFKQTKISETIITIYSLDNGRKINGINLESKAIFANALISDNGKHFVLSYLKNAQKVGQGRTAEQIIEEYDSNSGQVKHKISIHIPISEYKSTSIIPVAMSNDGQRLVLMNYYNLPISINGQDVAEFQIADIPDKPIALILFNMSRNKIEHINGMPPPFGIEMYPDWSLIKGSALEDSGGYLIYAGVAGEISLDALQVVTFGKDKVNLKEFPVNSFAFCQKNKNVYINKNNFIPPIQTGAPGIGSPYPFTLASNIQIYNLESGRRSHYGELTTDLSVVQSSSGRYLTVIERYDPKNEGDNPTIYVFDLSSCKLIYTVDLDDDDFNNIFDNKYFFSEKNLCFYLSRENKTVKVDIINNKLQLLSVSIHQIKGNAAKALDYNGEPKTSNFSEYFNSKNFFIKHKLVVKSNRVELWFNNQILSTLYLFKGDYVFTTPEGFFAGEGFLDRFIHFSKGPVVYDFNQFYDAFFRPDLVKIKIQGKDLGKYTRNLDMRSAIASPPPCVKIETPLNGTNINNPVVTAKVIVQDNQGGVGDIRLYVNGKLVQSKGYYRVHQIDENDNSQQLTPYITASRGIDFIQVGNYENDGQVNQSSIKPETGLVKKTYRVKLVSGKNIISACAFNGDNTVMSAMANTTVYADIPVKKPRLYVVAVGINHFEYGNDLTYPIKDSQDFKAMIERLSKGIYQDIEIRLLTDPDRKEIIEQIKNISNQVEPEDTFIFFAATHGWAQDDQYYLITSNFKGTEKSLKEGSITSVDLIEFSKMILSLKQVFFLDTCHSGGVGNMINGLYDARLSILAKTLGLHVFAASQAEETAADNYKENGLFTHVLLQALSGDADLNRDYFVSVLEMSPYIKNTVMRLSSQLKKTLEKSGHEWSGQRAYIINFGTDLFLTNHNN